MYFLIQLIIALSTIGRYGKSLIPLSGRRISSSDYPRSFVPRCTRTG